MEKLIKTGFWLGLVIGFILIHQSCTHDSFIVEDPDPMDTMDMEMPCDPELVYFSRDILPILNSSCALSGCHDAMTATEGIILDSYDNVIASDVITAFDLNDSDLYERITEDDPDKVMPPTGMLSNDKINLISKWILQGADNLECDDNMGPCDTEDVSYSAFVSGVFDTNCNGCHGTGIGNGGIVLDNYNSVKSAADSGRLFGAINWDAGFSRMPQNQDQLDECTIDKIKSWIDAGAPNN